MKLKNIILASWMRARSTNELNFFIDSRLERLATVSIDAEDELN